MNTTTKRFALILAVRRAVDADAQGIARECLETAVRTITAAPVGTFSDEPRGTVPVRTDLLDRLKILAFRAEVTSPPIADPAVYAKACRGAMETIERLLAAMADLESCLAALSVGEKCDHDVGLCWCPVFRALEEARDVRAAAGAPVVS